MSTPKSQSRFRVRSLFVRGESLVATTGMAFVAILAFALGGVVWVSARTIDDSSRLQLDERVEQTRTFLASQAELRLNDGDLPGLRRLLLDAVASGVVERCEVNHPDLGIIASSDAESNLLTQLPEDWASVPSITRSVTHHQESLQTSATEPLMVGGRPGMTLELSIHNPTTVIGADSVRASSVGIASAGLVLMLWVYRRFRNRLGALAAIGEALKVAAEGERRSPCLMVGEQLGSEAVVWNQLLKERDDLLDQQVQLELIEAATGTGVESIGLPAACNTLMQGVVLVESDLRIVYANGAAAVFLRTDRETMLESTLETVGCDEQIIEIARRVLSGNSLPREMVEIGEVGKLESGGAVLRVMAARVEQDDVLRVMLSIEDVTQQRLIDESQNAFIAQATHELRTPLTNIRLYAEEAIESEEDESELREKALNVINTESRRLERIVSDMLCVSEIEAGSLSIHRDSLRTEQLIEEIQADYEPQAKSKTIELVFDLPPKFPTIQADRDRLGQAMHNLVGNAIKYTPSGGKVEVQLEFDEHDAMIFKVSDNGIGIDESQQERIFERFCRADDRRIAKVTGSGLGLALARQIARLHGGDISVESQIDHGSVFTLFIPGTQEQAKAA